MSNFKDPSPSTIAREALQRLVTLKLPPTPDNFQMIYEEISGNKTVHNQMNTNARGLLSEFAAEIPRSSPELVNFSNTLTRAIRDNNWEKYKCTLLSRVMPTNAKVASSVKNVTQDSGISWNKTIELLLKKLETNHSNLTIAKKREGLWRVLTRFSNDSDQLKNKLHALIESWEFLATDTDERIEIVEQHTIDQSLASVNANAMKTATSEAVPSQNQIVSTQFTDQLPQLLAQILENIATIPFVDAEFAKQTSTLAKNIRKVQNKADMEQFVASYQEYLEKFEFTIEDNAKLQRGLLRLLNKLFENTRSVLTNDEWVRTQIAELQQTMSQPLSQRLIAQAENKLEEISQRQNIIKRGLSDARDTLKKMVACLISNIEGLTDETGEFHDILENYSNQISQTDDLEILNHLLVDLISETRRMQESTQHYRTGFISARAEVEAAQEKINELESELQHMSEKVHEDHLTGVLNRRGLDLAFEREISRAKRQQQPLCYALIDIDNFKKLNDAHGHKVGDDALIYLVDLIKTTTRIDDIVARYGGEEFVVLLPNTKMSDAIEILSRVRRNLTKQFFLHDNKRLLITFSAGVAEYTNDETQESIFKRADEALYRAKKNGKNLILEAV